MGERVVMRADEDIDTSNVDTLDSISPSSSSCGLHTNEVTPVHRLHYIVNLCLTTDFMKYYSSRIDDPPISWKSIKYHQAKGEYNFY